MAVNFQTWTITVIAFANLTSRDRNLNVFLPLHNFIYEGQYQCAANKLNQNQSLVTEFGSLKYV